MKDWLEALGYIVLLAVAVVAGVLFFTVVIWFVVMILALFVAVWLLGVRWTISKEGKVIGHLRWFTFTPVRPIDQQPQP
jgi:large-conductance mechanosensitive channel